MRCPKCHAETSFRSHRCPKCKLLTPRGRAAQQGENTTPPRTIRIPEVAMLGRRALMLMMGLTVFVAGLASYLITSNHLTSRAAEVPAEIAVQKLRSLPSNLIGFSVDELLNHKVNRSRDEGKLLEAEGWGATHLEGNKYLVCFSFEEKGRKQLRAEWFVDVDRNSFVPKTDLAAAIYNR